MTRTEFDKELSVITQLPVKNIQAMMKVFGNRLNARIRSGNLVHVPQFCQFYVALWQGRNMYDMHTETVRHFDAKLIVKAKGGSWLYQDMNPLWNPTRSFTDIRTYPDCDIAQRMFLMMQTDYWQIRLFVYEFARFGNYLISIDENFEIPYVGTFRRAARAAHTCYPPPARFPTPVEERYRMKFRQCNLIREQIN